MVPRVKVPSPALAALTLKPVLPVTVAPATDAVALMVVAPAAVRVAASICMEATPDALVSAVPVDGVIAASVEFVEKVTTVFATPEPAASLMVASTLAGLPGLMLDSAAPLLGSVRAMLTPGVPTLVATTLKLALPDTDAPDTVAVAVTVSAPAAIALAATIWIDATPAASVSAVPDAGTIVANPADATKLTTVLGTTAPEASRIVAVTLAGLTKLMLVTAAPVLGLVSATVTPVPPLLVAITLNPTLLDRLAPPEEADALMVVAPAAVGLAATI